MPPEEEEIMPFFSKLQYQPLLEFPACWPTDLALKISYNCVSQCLKIYLLINISIYTSYWLYCSGEP